MKEALLIIGCVVGSILTLIGGLAKLISAKPDGEGMLALLWLTIGIPCLVVGVPMLGLCIWGLAR